MLMVLACSDARWALLLQPSHDKQVMMMKKGPQSLSVDIYDALSAHIAFWRISTTNYSQMGMLERQMTT
jgi:hypothetical protein